MPLKGLTPGISLASFPSPIPPVSGGGLPSPLDWSAYQTLYDWSGTLVSIPATSWSTFVNVAGEGWLTFAQAFANPFVIPDVRITVDGVAYLFTGFNSSTSYIGNIINQPIYFKSSLKVEVFNSSASANTFGCDYTYLLKSGSPNRSKQSILLASSRNVGFNTNTTVTASNIVNITGSGYLLGAEFTGDYNSITGNVKGTVIVDGVTKMNARLLYSIAGTDIKLVHFDGPIRFITSLQVQHFVDTAGAAAGSKVFYTLD